MRKRWFLAGFVLGVGAVWVGIAAALGVFEDDDEDWQEIRSGYGGPPIRASGPWPSGDEIDPGVFVSRHMLGRRR